MTPGSRSRTGFQPVLNVQTESALLELQLYRHPRWIRTGWKPVLPESGVQQRKESHE